MAKSKILAVFTILTLFALGFTMLPTRQASALSASDWNPGNIIDDSVFYNSNAMDAGQIQRFLNAKVGTCDVNGSQPYGGGTRADYGRSVGYPPPYHCVNILKMSTPERQAESGICSYLPASSSNPGFWYGTKTPTAAQVIAKVSAACNINPQVMLVLMQKESGLVTDTWPFPSQLDKAMSFACPDTSGCDTSYYGFFNQVYSAARQFQRYRADPSNWNYVAGRNNFILYHPHCSSGSTIYIQNAATASLYDYTPYQPDRAAINYKFGSGSPDGCSSYGNINFWLFFNDWFGPTRLDIYSWNVIKEESGDGKYYLRIGNTKRWIPTAQLYKDWGLDSVPLDIVSSAYFNSIPTIPSLGRIGLLKDGRYVFIDHGDKWIIGSSASIANWGFSSLERQIAAPLYSLLGDMPTAGTLTKYVKDSSTNTNYLMSGGQLYPISTPYIDRWGIKSPTSLNPTTISLINKGSALDYRVSFSGNNFIVDSGRLLKITPQAASAYGDIANSFVGINASVKPLFPVTDASRVVKPNDVNKWYMILDGKAHYVQHSNILRGWNAPSSPQTISRALFSQLGSASNLTALVQSGSRFYYLDAGVKHEIPSNMLNAWTAGDSVTTVDESDLTQLSGNSFSSPIFQVAGTPNLYTMVGGSYYHIPTYNVLHALGSPEKYAITRLSPYVFSQLHSGGSASQYITNGGTTYYLQGGKAYPIAASAIDTWTTGHILSYSGTDFSQRFNVQSAQFSALIKDSGGQRWIVNNGTALNISRYADAYSFAPFANLDSLLIRKGGTASYLAKSLNSNKIWLISNGGKQWLTNWAEYTSYGGGRMPVTVLNDSLLSDIPDKTPAGGPSIIIQTNSSGLKLLVDGKYYGFPDGDTLLNTIAGNPVTNVSSSIFNTLDQRVGVMSRVIKDSSNGRIYYMQNGKKRWITSGRAYDKYRSIRLITLPSNIINWFPTGSPIN